MTNVRGLQSPSRGFDPHRRLRPLTWAFPGLGGCFASGAIQDVCRQVTCAYMVDSTESVRAYVERLAQDPEFIRQCEESERRWNRQLRELAEGDEAGAAEMRADIIDVNELRRRYLPADAG